MRAGRWSGPSPRRRSAGRSGRGRWRCGTPVGTKVAAGRTAMAGTQGPMDPEHAAALKRRYLIDFEADTLRSRPLWVRMIIEFLGTFMLVTVAAGAGVIDRYAGGDPISRAAAVIAPGALVMALIYAWGPLSGLHINPVVTLAFAGRGVFRP